MKLSDTLTKEEFQDLFIVMLDQINAQNIIFEIIEKGFPKDIFFAGSNHVIYKHYDDLNFHESPLIPHETIICKWTENVDHPIPGFDFGFYDEIGPPQKFPCSIISTESHPRGVWVPTSVIDFDGYVH